MDDVFPPENELTLHSRLLSFNATPNTDGKTTQVKIHELLVRAQAADFQYVIPVL